jgi:hypothetical protein
MIFGFGDYLKNEGIWKEECFGFKNDNFNIKKLSFDDVSYKGRLRRLLVNV